MLVELKNGETLNGHLVNCDTYMNLTLKEVVQTSPEGDKFFRLPECYVRGNNVCRSKMIILVCGTNGC
jgi:U6 snRNA-associated Sm-like protein LSm4